MTARTGLPALPAAPCELTTDPLDEFDLDIRWGELGPHGGWQGYLPTAGEVPGETCDTHAGTCAATCQATCAATCHATCPATCHATCAATCHATCEEFDSCGATCAQTHCFTCRSGCQTP